MLNPQKQKTVGIVPALDEAAPPATTQVSDEAIQRLVAAAVEKAVSALAPAVHTEDRRSNKAYLDDMAEEIVGTERMDVRRENEQRSALEDARSPFSPTSIRERNQMAIRGGAGMKVAEFVGWLSCAKGDPDRAYRMAKKSGGSAMIVRALGESTFSAGGAFVPENIAADYIELLYNVAVFLQAGPVEITVTNGNLTMPKLTGGATPTWIGESENAAASQQTTGQVRIDLKKLAVLTAAANEFIRDSGPSAVQMIRDDLARAAAVAIDAAALRGLGTAYTPKGLRGWVPSANQYASTGTSVAQITTDAAKAFRLIEEGKILSTRLAVFTSPRTKWGLMAARDGNNNEVWAPELRQGTWYGAKFFATPNIPTNVGGGGNKSEIYVAAMEHLVFAQEPAGIRVDVADGPAYYDGSNVVSGFSRDESAVRLVQRLDIVDRQNGAGIVQIYDVAIA